MQFDAVRWLREFQKAGGVAALTSQGHFSTTRELRHAQRDNALRLLQQLADPRQLKAVWDHLRSCDPA